ncbi:MAG TPA: hypothetical protein QGG91_05010 [Flavobacteriales bacterium]|nr:hypothetical protein [Flavobacteriales bacterium]
MGILLLNIGLICELTIRKVSKIKAYDCNMHNNSCSISTHLDRTCSWNFQDTIYRKLKVNQKLCN